MKTSEFKVHSVYTKEDILQMQKIVTAKLRRRGLLIVAAVLVLYAAAFIFETVKGEGYASLFSSSSGPVLDVILMAVLVFLLILILALPYLQRGQILKAAPGGVLKANFYFYDKTFQYGWGDHFSTVAYSDIEEFKSLSNTYYMKAKGIAYWVKKSDFTAGSPEEFGDFIKSKTPRL